MAADSGRRWRNDDGQVEGSRRENQAGARRQMPGERLAQAGRIPLARRPLPRGIPLRVREGRQRGRAARLLRARKLGAAPGDRVRGSRLRAAGRRRRRVVDAEAHRLRLARLRELVLRPHRAGAREVLTCDRVHASRNSRAVQAPRVYGGGSEHRNPDRRGSPRRPPRARPRARPRATGA